MLSHWNLASKKIQGKDGVINILDKIPEELCIDFPSPSTLNLIWC